MSHPLQAVYDRVPVVACKGHCGRDRHNSCCGPIGATYLEVKHLEEYLGIESQWLEHRGALVMDVEAMGGDLTCPHLGPDGRCRSYEVRPLVCRV